MAPHVRNVRLLRNVVPQTRILDVLHHADDFHIRACSRIASETHVHADGTPSRKEFLRELLVDHHRRWRPVILLRPFLDFVVIRQPEVPPRNNRHAQRGKVSRTDQIHVRLRPVLRLARSVPFHRHAAVPLVVFQNPHTRQSYGLHSGNRAQRVRQLLVINFCSLRSVAAQRRIDIESHQPLRGKSWAEIAQVFQAAQKQTRPNQQQQRKRHLRHHQRLPQSRVATADHRAGFILQDAAYIRPRGLQCWHKPKQDSRQNRYA